MCKDLSCRGISMHKKLPIFFIENTFGNHGRAHYYKMENYIIRGKGSALYSQSGNNRKISLKHPRREIKICGAYLTYTKN